MPEPASIELADRLQREEALDTRQSFLVQAPAGSGKTELLAMRYLKLLSEVDDPAEILAITFTKYATAEMRHRVLKKLERAKQFKESGTLLDDEDPAALEIVTGAYTNSMNRGWRLLERPQNLNIQSIDSLSLRIAHQLPLSVQPGGILGPTAVSEPLYREAGRRTFDGLGGRDEELGLALRELLLLRDSNLAACEELLARMLATRDQWMRVFPLSGEVDWEQTRARLESPFLREIDRVLGQAHACLCANPALTQELLELAVYACGNLAAEGKISAFAGFQTLPVSSRESLDSWICLCDGFLTKNHKMLKRYNASHGFPPNEMNKRMLALGRALDDVGFMDLLRLIRGLPSARYTEKQWSSLRHIFVALRRAVSQLETVFSEQGVVDFVEIGIAARKALSERDAELPFVNGVRHLLVDEFQDTSRQQHDFLAALLRGWRPETGSEAPRTLFMVGDPMQSIYMFRQADVELFDLVRKHGFATGGGHLPLNTLQLATNFRSNAGVVKPLNRIFRIVFPYGAKEGSAAVDFLPGVPKDFKEPKGAFQIHSSFAEAKDKNSRPEPPPGGSDRDLETEEVLKVIRRHQRKVYRARLQNEDFTVAVLVRAKNHLIPIAAALRREGIRFRAVELEELGERQEVLDLQSLTRALLHPMDRIAWLALLRAPWCGLDLRDLHRLCGTDADRSGGGAVLQQIEEHLSELGAESRARVSRVISILRAAIGNRHRQSSFSSWIERTWTSLGGPACVDAAGYENAQAYFRMLERVTPDGIAATGEIMRRQLDSLFASPDPSVSERCGVQLMTMHKAKGLGFNVVLLPGLHRPTRRDETTLIRYLERATGAGTELLAAPIDDAASQSSPLNKWVSRQMKNREAEEHKRLLYVACTRARQELHLFATAKVTKAGLSARTGTLLGCAWPALQREFEERYTATTPLRPIKVLEFQPANPQQLPFDGVLDSVAAAGRGTILHRLPSLWAPKPITPNVAWIPSRMATYLAESRDERRLQGSRSSRILGTTVHALFEHAAGLFAKGKGPTDIREALPQFRSYAHALVRGEGLPPQETDSVAQSALLALQNAMADPTGLWILNSHPEAQTESSWTGVIDGAPRTLRIDYSFRAGAEPLSEGADFLWIVDYKTATHGISGVEAFLDAEKQQYAEQLESYAKIMRLAQGNELRMCLGLYYPFLRRLVWWPAQLQ
jgi:ATP-dependent helicase/nuclease subunit A